MVLAAGFGKRMRPLTDTLPKPLIPVGGKPMLDRLLDQLARAGVDEAIVNTHYLGEKIISHLAGRKAPRITISEEREKPLETGGGVLKVIDRFSDGPFFSLNADTLWLDGPRNNFDRMREAFDPEKMDILLLISPVVTTIGWGNRGDFTLDAHGRLRRPTPGIIAPFAYIGAAILKPELFVDCPEEFSLNLLFDRAIAADRLYGLRLDGIAMHVGTPEALAEAERTLAKFDR